MINRAYLLRQISANVKHIPFIPLLVILIWLILRRLAAGISPTTLAFVSQAIVLLLIGATVSLYALTTAPLFINILAAQTAALYASAALYPLTLRKPFQQVHLIGS